MMATSVYRLTAEEALELCGVLLRDDAWRQRVVERIQPLSSDHYRLTSSYQFELTSQFTAHVGGADTLSGALLPVAWLPKMALLDLDITGPGGGRLVLLERRSIAGIVAHVLSDWQDEAGCPVSVRLSEDELESVCLASLSVWRRLREDASNVLDAAEEYVVAGTGHSLRRPWLRESLAAADVLAQQADRVLGSELFQLGPTCENTALNSVVLAPYLYPRAGSAAGLRVRMRSIEERLAALLAAAEADEAVRRFAVFLINCGLRWPAIVSLTAPVDRPFLIKLAETRSSGHNSPRRLVHAGDVASSRSYHLHVHSPASAIALRGDPTVKAARGIQVDLLFEGGRRTRELFATYTSQTPRPAVIRAEVRFKLSRPVAAAYAFGVLLTSAAGAYALLAPSLDAQTATVLTVPTAVLSGLLLTQGHRLLVDFLRGGQYVLIALNLVLWTVVLGRLGMAFSGQEA